MDNVERVISCNNSLVVAILKSFCSKQGFIGCEFSDINVNGIIIFNGQFGIAFSDILLDIEFNIKKGIAVNYMQGFDLDLDDAQISKEFGYKEYLESKKLI
jgi:hypothetical protein